MPHRNRDSHRIYFRSLPGGGYVSIEVTENRSLLGKRHYRGEVVVERRIEQQRRAGHPPPAVAESTGATPAAILHTLFPLAQSNTAIANACLALRRPELIEA